jgi:protein SCO1/2
MPFPVHRGLQRILLGILGATIAAVMIAFVFQSWKAAEQKQGASLDRFNAVSEFSFEDQNGKKISLADLKGNIWVADFILTRSPGPSSILSGRFAELDRNFQKSDQLKLISFSVDPGFDTPAILKQYSEKFEASDRWHFLTGEKAALYGVAVEGFKLMAQDPKSVTPDFIQSTKFVLVDADGVIRAYYDGTSPEVVQRLLTDIGSLLRQRER